MINAAEKEFWFKELCYDVIRAYYHMVQCADEDGVCGDTSRVSAFKQAEVKLVGMCIPYQYYPYIEYVQGKTRAENSIAFIEIRCNSTDRVYLKYRAEDDVEDLR